MLKPNFVGGQCSTPEGLEAQRKKDLAELREMEERFRLHHEHIAGEEERWRRDIGVVQLDRIPHLDEVISDLKTIRSVKDEFLPSLVKCIADAESCLYAVTGRLSDRRAWSKVNMRHVLSLTCDDKYGYFDTRAWFIPGIGGRYRGRIRRVVKLNHILKQIDEINYMSKQEAEDLSLYLNLEPPVKGGKPGQIRAIREGFSREDALNIIGLYSEHERPGVHLEIVVSTR